MPSRKALAQEKLGALIERGKRSAAEVVRRIQTEVPHDAIIKGSVMEFIPRRATSDYGEGYALKSPRTKVDDRIVREVPMHGHAFEQACGRAGVPMAFVRHVEEKGDWGPPLVARTLTEIYGHDSARYLVRTAGGSVRGFLSDRYRRMDSRPIFDAFAGACKNAGIFPYEGRFMDTRLYVHAVLPELFEPFDGEVVAFGMTFENSDYGDGALSLRLFILRLICINGAVGTEDMMRKVHLGKRLQDDVRYSEETHRLDTRTQASAVRDVIRDRAGRLHEYADAIRAAHEQKIEVTRIKAFLKATVLKGEAEDITQAFASPDIENLPPGQNKWRLSNAISWVAGKSTDDRRKIELQKVAGAALDLAA